MKTLLAALEVGIRTIWPGKLFNLCPWSRSRRLMAFFVATSLSFVSLAATAEERSVIIGFTACAPNGGGCIYAELEAPYLMACMTQGQTAVQDWLRRFNRPGWTLQRGWKCFVNRPGEEQEA
jgi:hypothetical protein